LRAKGVQFRSGTGKACRVLFELKPKLEGEIMERAKTHKDRKIDKAVDMTFPASDAPAHGHATGTEPPRRPADRKAPHVTKEQIEQAQRGEGHKEIEPAQDAHDENRERKH